MRTSFVYAPLLPRHFCKRPIRARELELNAGGKSGIRLLLQPLMHYLLDFLVSLKLSPAHPLSQFVNGKLLLQL